MEVCGALRARGVRIHMQKKCTHAYLSLLFAGGCVCVCGLSLLLSR